MPLDEVTSDQDRTRCRGAEMRKPDWGWLKGVWEVRKWRRLARKRRREQGRKRAPCGYVGLGGRGKQVWAGPEILGKGCSAGGRRGQ